MIPHTSFILRDEDYLNHTIHEKSNMSTDIDFQDQPMPVQTLAVNWYEAAIDREVSEPTKDYFRFMAIWLGFSALYESFACDDGFSLMETNGGREKLKPAHKVWKHYLEKKTNIRQRHNHLRMK